MAEPRRGQTQGSRETVPWRNPECVRLLDIVLRASRDQIYIYDREGRLEYASPRDLAEIGLDRTSVLGKTWRQLGLPAGSLTPFEDLMQRVFATGETHSDEGTFPTPLGTRTYSYTYTPIYAPDGTIEAVVSAVRDVTNERQAERALMVSEERFRALAEATCEGIAIHDRGRILIANQALAEMFGYALEDVIGKSALDFAAPESRAEVDRHIQECLDEPYEAVGIRKDGSRFPIELHAKTTTYQGLPIRVTILRDISRFKESEQALRKAESRWKTLLAFTPSIIYTLSPDLKITFINHVDAGFEMAGVAGHSIFEFLDTDDRDAVRAHYEAVLKTGAPVSFEVSLLANDGQRHWYQNNAALLHTEAQAPQILVITTDVTRLKLATEALARKQAELAQAKELERLKSNFVNAVTHELRTPLTSIIGFTEFLEDGVGGPLSEGQLQFVHEIQGATQRLDNLVGDLLDFARMEAGTFRLRIAEEDLRDKIRETVRSLEPQVRDAQLKLDVDLPETPLEVLADPQRIGQVLLNLLQNAVKFTPPGGSIRLSAQQIGAQVVCEVSDSGPGIAPEEIPKLFRAFSQLEHGLKKGVGTGLGLSISKAIIEAHGGTIGVRSTPAHGATFWFSLPVAPSTPVEPNAR
ncbi:MAG TPA: PAS domain S-box protein [Oscillatoriaceae cyanobacterium]